MRLCALASEKWSELCASYYQIDLRRQRPWFFLSLVYSWCIERVQHDKLDDWLMELHDLLPWQDASSEAAVTMESESFMNMMSKG